MMYTLHKIINCDESTLLGMNGGQPESPDGKLLVYAKKAVLNDALKQTTEIWVCDRDTCESHKKIFTVTCGNHNGPSATFVDNTKIVFRDTIDGLSAFRIVDVYTGGVIYGPIFAKESHCSENGKYPFSISEEFLGKNPNHPGINSCGIYLLDIASGSIDKVVDTSDILNLVKTHGYTPTEYTASMSHVQLNPSATSVMMRLSVLECPKFGALGCFDLASGEGHIIADKPVHQLWFDDDTYMATRQYFSDHIEMETSWIGRFSKDGEELEVLGGIGNHIDGSPDRKYFVGDSAYPKHRLDILLYRRGEKEPIAVLDSQNFQHIVWQLQVHPNPTFSRDAKRVYFNRPISEDKTQAVFVDISDII